MALTYVLLISIGICAVAAALEGLCAGQNVKAFYAELHFPRYSAPLWVWMIIGGVYYIIFWFILYRLLLVENRSFLWIATFILILFMMIVNAFTNYAIFRLRNITLSFVITCIFPFMDVALFVCLLRLDRLAGCLLIPYLVYRVYSLWWSYGLWKLNPRARE